jgi:hypothetical protein
MSRRYESREWKRLIGELWFTRYWYLKKRDKFIDWSDRVRFKLADMITPPHRPTILEAHLIAWNRLREERGFISEETPKPVPKIVNVGGGFYKKGEPFPNFPRLTSRY